MLTSNTKKLRESRFSIRASIEQKELIVRAAQAKHKTVSEFVLENALVAAEAVLADNARFVLSDERWEMFCAALDAPPKAKPNLNRLMTETGVFDER